MLILSRAIQGIGFAIVPLGLALIADIFPREKVATAQGIISGTFAIGAAAGLVIGAYVVQDLGWQWAFHTAFILSIILFLLVTKMLKKDPPGVKSKVDYAGATILMSGIVLVLLGLGCFLLRAASTETNIPMLVFGTLVLMPGLGFIISAGVTWVLAGRLGLMPQNPKAPVDSREQ